MYLPISSLPISIELMIVELLQPDITCVDIQEILQIIQNKISQAMKVNDNGHPLNIIPAVAELVQTATREDPLLESRTPADDILTKLWIFFVAQMAHETRQQRYDK
jgi:hypothetical protein